jgi:hypothetical protein
VGLESCVFISQISLQKLQLHSSQNDPGFASKSEDVSCVVSGKVFTFLINVANKASSTHLLPSSFLEHTCGDHKMASIKRKSRNKE